MSSRIAEDREGSRHRRERVLAQHICDWRVPTHHLTTEGPIMVGGVIDIRGIRARVEATGFAGPKEVESDRWPRDPDEILSVTIERGRSAS